MVFWNQCKTALLLGILSGLFLLLGYGIGGQGGIVVAFIFSLAMNFLTYFFSDKMVLAMYGAQPLDKARYTHVYEMVEELCYIAQVPMPKLWYIKTTMANAFATGRNPEHASVAVTQGILDILEDHELRGVLAHEISHIKNRDILISTIAATIATAIGYLANMMQWAFIFGRGSSSREDNRDSWLQGLGAILAAIFMPLAATLIQLAISRSREYLADETGAQCCQDPLALASALEKLGSATAGKTEPHSAAQASTASLFIVYPFTTHGILHLFSTHPPMAERIRRLRAMAQRRY